MQQRRGECATDHGGPRPWLERARASGTAPRQPRTAALGMGAHRRMRQVGSVGFSTLVAIIRTLTAMIRTLVAIIHTLVAIIRTVTAIIRTLTAIIMRYVGRRVCPEL